MLGKKLLFMYMGVVLIVLGILGLMPNLSWAAMPMWEAWLDIVFGIILVVVILVGKHKHKDMYKAMPKSASRKRK